MYKRTDELLFQGTFFRISLATLRIMTNGHRGLVQFLLQLNIAIMAGRVFGRYELASI